MDNPVMAAGETQAPPAPLGRTVLAAMDRSGPVLAAAREELDRRRRELAEAESALAEAEDAALRRLEAAVESWRVERGRRSLEGLDRAAAWSIASELAEVDANREVVLDTIHPSLHEEIAEAFERRIADLEERARTHAPLGDDPEPPEPVVVGAAWVRSDPPGVAVAALALDSPAGSELRGAARAALERVAERLGGGEVRSLEGGDGSLPLLLAETAAEAPAATEVAAWLSEEIGRALASADGWPPAAEAVVEPVDGDAGRALQAVLPAEGT